MNSMADCDGLRLLDLPVEILCTIFSMVFSADRVNLAQVCQRFDSVLRLPELIRSLDFQRAYELDFHHAYFFLKDKTRCNFITSVNLTSCYWLSSSTIRQCLIRLKKLETMLVADTKLTYSDLKALLSALPQVKNLAISWTGPVDIGSKTEDLQSIYLYVPALKEDPAEDICNFLKLCKRIEKISIVTYPLRMSHWDRCRTLMPVQKVSLSYLRSLLICSGKGCQLSFSDEGVISFYNKAMLAKLLTSETNSKPAWESFLIPSNLKRGYEVTDNGQTGLMISLKRNVESNESIMDRACINLLHRNFPLLDDSVFQSLLKLRSLSVYCRHKDMDVAISSMFREECQLEELNIYGNDDGLGLTFCETMPASLSSYRLRKLRLPSSAIWRKKVPQLSSSNSDLQGLCKRPRVSHLTAKESLEDSPFLNLVKSCPNVEEFAMDDYYEGCGNALKLHLPNNNEWDSQQLIHIANWKKLKKLTLGSIPISSFMFLDTIARCCPMVTSLALNYMHLTASAVSMAGLVKALPLFTKLEDLAIRQPRGRSVLDALHQESLRRVVIICNKVSESDCARFLANCTKVVFLYIECEITQTEIGRIRSHIRSRFAQRQAFCFDIFPIENHLDERPTREFRNVPGIHLCEMLARQVFIGGPIPGNYFIQCE